MLPLSLIPCSLWSQRTTLPEPILEEDRQGNLRKGIDPS
jgi:hypothetical protein